VYNRNTAVELATVNLSQLGFTHTQQ